MKKKKILFVIGAMGRGGKERRLQVLLKHLSEKDDYEIHFAIRKDLIAYHEFKNYNLKYYQILVGDESKIPFKSLYRLYRLTKKIQPDILHIWSGAEVTLMAPIAKILRIPLINNEIGYAKDNDKLFSNLQRWIKFSLSSVIIANSYAGIDAAKPPLHKSRVIHNGFDSGRFAGKESFIRQELCISNDAVVVVMVSRFSPGKDYETLLNAAENILFGDKNVYFVFVGDGPERKKLERLNNNRDKIKFLGQRIDIEEILLGCDIGVLLNDTDISKEGLSNSIMEYMAAGLPVVATNAGGNPELIINNETGFLIENKDKEQLIDRLEQLISNNELRKKMGDKGQERIKNTFSLERFVEKHEEIIEKFIK